MFCGDNFVLIEFSIELSISFCEPYKFKTEKTQWGSLGIFILFCCLRISEFDIVLVYVKLEYLCI